MAILSSILPINRLWYYGPNFGCLNPRMKLPPSKDNNVTLAVKSCRAMIKLCLLGRPSALCLWYSVRVKD